MPKPVVITADSTIDLSPELLKRYHVSLIPLHIVLGDRSLRDGVDITPDDIYATYRSEKILPKTAAINPEAYKSFFSQYTANGASVVHFSLSSGISATHQNACLAAEELEDVYVVDTKSLSTGSSLLVIKAAELAAQGYEAHQIFDLVSPMWEKVDASFILDKLEFLHKGGRCSGVAALGANLLKLKPCIELKDGTMSVGKKYRGSLLNVQMEYVAAKLQGKDNLDPARIFITHSGIDSSIIEAVERKIRELYSFREILITRAGCTISSHCGPNTLGILFMYQ